MGLRRVVDGDLLDDMELFGLPADAATALRRAVLDDIEPKLPAPQKILTRADRIALMAARARSGEDLHHPHDFLAYEGSEDESDPEPIRSSPDATMPLQDALDILQGMQWDARQLEALRCRQKAIEDRRMKRRASDPDPVILLEKHLRNAELAASKAGRLEAADEIRKIRKSEFPDGKTLENTGRKNTVRHVSSVENRAAGQRKPNIGKR